MGQQSPLSQTFGKIALNALRIGEPGEERGWFKVEASDDALTKGAAIAVLFEHASEAQRFANALDAHAPRDPAYPGRRYHCVWLSEWGEWYTNCGTPKVEYLYNWWSRGVETVWGTQPERGYGRPLFRRTPVAYCASRM